MATAEPRAAAPEPASPPKHRNPWMWVSLGLAVVAAGLLIWALASRSDLDDAQQEVANLNAEVAQGKQKGSDAAAAVKDVAGDLEQQVSSTNEDLAASEQQVEQAQQDAADAEREATAAKETVSQATSETDKAQAEAAAATADAKAAQSKLDVAADCARSYVAAFEGLAEGQASEQVKQQLGRITADCRSALAGAG